MEKSIWVVEMMVPAVQYGTYKVEATSREEAMDVIKKRIKDGTIEVDSTQNYISWGLEKLAIEEEDWHSIV